MAYNEYTKLCIHVSNLSWNQWIIEFNANPNSAGVWRRIKAVKGSHHNLGHRKKQTHNVTHLNNDAAPKRVHTITTATYKQVDSDQAFAYLSNKMYYIV